MTGSRLTAILTCRNAEATLARCLAHLADHGADVVLVDHGSTDGTRAIAEAYRGAPVAEIRTDPYLGYFDLSAQLRLKAEIIMAAGNGWVLHADADEFLDTPDGTALSDYLQLWERSDVVAFDCDETVFLPTSEADVHAPDRFPETMQSGLTLRERDRKQRLFRAGTPLDLWIATGGHTVSHIAAPVVLGLRHYIGLSLDLIRSEYLGRVFAPRDLAKAWHTTRQGTGLCVVPPPDGAVSDISGTLPDAKALPVFAPARGCARVPADDGPVDLTLASFKAETADKVQAALSQAFPGIRVGAGIRGAVPHLCVHEHPATAVPGGSIEHAEAWLRHTASARQTALWGAQPMYEVRVEEAGSEPATLIHAVRGLLAQPAPARRLVTSWPERAVPGYGGHLQRITGALARDLGYA
ncbi:MAG: glycosyltransferase family 2 protein [Pseudomonadota bacterium]